LEELLSTWKPTSEISRVNEAAGREPVKVSSDTLFVLTKSIEMAAYVHAYGPSDRIFYPVQFFYLDALGFDDAQPRSLLTVVDRHEKAGDDALLMVRPESLVLGGQARAVDSGAVFGEGKVTKAVYLGSVIEYELDAGYGKPLMAISHDPVNGEFYKVGDRIPFSFSRRAAHILPLR